VTFTKLAGSVANGSSTITVVGQTGWRPGDHLVITSTSLNPSESEEGYIASISGSKISLAAPLKYPHDGAAPAQGEVADLTRNVVVTSLNQSRHAMGVMFMYGAKGSLSFAEFSHLGAEGIVGKYPIHFHHVQNSMRGTLVEGVSVWDSHNRFITIHNTDGIRVKDSVGYESIGHGFFLEDGTEENNTLIHNISVLTLPGAVRPDDASPAGYWVQNPRNNFTRNIAVSAGGSGFDLSFPDKAPEVIPFSLGNFLGSLNQATTPTVLSITEFSNNEAHSNAGDGFHLYRLDYDPAGDVNVFRTFSSWRNDGFGMDITASPALISSSLFFGNANGNTIVNSYNMTIARSNFLGELPGVGGLINETNGGSMRYMVAPVGLVSMASNITISDSAFGGHRASGYVAKGDILVQVGEEGGFFTIFVHNVSLQSNHTIIFGYPMDGRSFIRVQGLNGDPRVQFTLYRYDTHRGPGCVLDLNYMATQCTG